MTFADLVLAPVTPSATARSGGTIYPIVRSIPELYGSLPNDPSSKRVGAYLLYTALASTMVTSSMFLTGLAPNTMAIALIAKGIGVTIPWMLWFKGFLPVGVVLLLVQPALLYVIYPPEIKQAPEAPRWAAEQLREMGRCRGPRSRCWPSSSPRWASGSAAPRSSTPPSSRSSSSWAW